MKHLRDREEYVDRYDRATVKDCRWREEFHRTCHLKDKETRPKVQTKLIKCVGEITLHIDLLYTTLDWQAKKESTINEWMEEDRRKDDLFDTAQPPRNIRCSECLALMSTNEKMLYDLFDKEMKVLFFFDCPRGCEKRKAIFNDGSVFVPNPLTCEKCGTEVTRKVERTESLHRTIYTCPSCSYVEVDEFDFNKEKEVDPEYENDRARFCLSGAALREAQEERMHHEQLKHVVDRMKEKEEHAAEYEAVKALKKLTVSELEKILVEVTEKAGYEKFQLDPPSLERIATVSFATRDTQGERPDRESTHALMKDIKKTLKNTNWRLMSDGVSYRLGVLTGRLRAYESEEDLLKLVKE